MSYRLEFELPGLPKPFNGQTSMNWRKKGREVKRWHMAVFLAVGIRKPAQPLRQAKITLYRFSSVQPDFDGLVSSFKPVIDGLIHAQVIENDRMENIGMPTFIWDKAKPKAGKIRIIVEEIIPKWETK